MDVTSYLLGKKAGGGGDTPTGEIDITTNGVVNVTSYATANVNVQPILESKSVSITTNGTTTVNPTVGKDGLSSVEVITNVSGGGGTPTNLTELNNVLSDFDDYLVALVDNYTAYTNEPITIYTPDVDSTSFMIQKRSNGKYRMVWCNFAFYLCLVSNSSQSFGNNYLIGGYYKFSQPLLLNVLATSGPLVKSYYSSEFNTLEDLVVALQNSNGSGISYTVYNKFGFSGVLDATWTSPISNLPVFESDKTTPFLNGKVLSHDTTILPFS